MPEKFEQQEQEKKYTLPDKNIIGAEDDSIIRKKMGKFIEGLESEGLSLPVELQGGANDLVDRREFAIHYPVGDLFISYIVPSKHYCDQFIPKLIIHPPLSPAG